MKQSNTTPIYQQVQNQDDFLSNLASAINQQELCLHYQPRYDVNSGEANTIEALVRWQKPNVGLLYPEAFIEAAEKTSLIFQLDLWVFEQCCKDLLSLRENLQKPVKLAVNISVLSCESVYFSQKLIELCEQYDISLSDFVLEITTSTHAHDIRKVKAFCETLGNYGATICLDDFGTGQSPLSNLYHLPIDYVMIDRLFVSAIGESERSEIIINQLVKLAHEPEISVIACGVEQAYQCKYLVDHGVDVIQGYLMSRPNEPEKLSSADLSL